MENSKNKENILVSRMIVVLYFDIYLVQNSVGKERDKLTKKMPLPGQRKLVLAIKTIHVSINA